MKTSNINQKCENESRGTLRVCLFAGFSNETYGELQAALTGVTVNISKEDQPQKIYTYGVTGQNEQDAGCVNIPLECGTYIIGLPRLPDDWGDWPYEACDLVVEILDCKCTKREYIVPASRTCLAFNTLIKGDDCKLNPCAHITRGNSFWLQVIMSRSLASATASPLLYIDNGEAQKAQKITEKGFVRFEAQMKVIPGTKDRFTSFANIPLTGDPDGPAARLESVGDVGDNEKIIGGHITTTTTLTRTATSPTPDTALFIAINNVTDALSFDNYMRFMDVLFCHGEKNKVFPNFEQSRFDKKIEEYDGKEGLLKRRFLSFTDGDAYRVVKAATEAFVMVNCGVLDGNFRPFDQNQDNDNLNNRDLPIPAGGLADNFEKKYLVEVNGIRILPYLAVIRSKLPDIPIQIKALDRVERDTKDLDECYGLLQEKLVNPCFLELIWSYWLEEGMQIQTMNAISRRFQNMRTPNAHDPLANLEMNPLRSLNNLMWGYIQDEQHRLSVIRRNYEYDHHYGLRLEGKAVQNFRPADTRSKFLEGFHHLLRLCTVFYKQDDDTTVKADAFPILNALKEVHLILSEGAHNQFGDLPSTARIEMLIQQWFLARPEFREFLPTRIMVAYPEPWMDRVDAMKKLQGWTDTSVLHFRNLAVFGEKLLLSIRWGHWSVVYEPTQAFNWARLYRPHVQGYIHAYRAATGIDLSADPTVDTRVDATQPSMLLRKRLATQQRAN